MVKAVKRGTFSVPNKPDELGRGHAFGSKLPNVGARVATVAAAEGASGGDGGNASSSSRGFSMSSLCPGSCAQEGAKSARQRRALRSGKWTARRKTR